MRLLVLLLVLSACAPTRNDLTVARTTPGSIVIEFVPPSVFSATYGATAEGAAWYNESPCRIIFPSGMAIEYSADPATPHPEARFVERANADTFAHEVLHCVVGHWHSS